MANHLFTDAPIYTVTNLFEANEGDTLTINLGLDGFPLPPSSFSWMFDNQPLAGDSRIILGVDSIEFSPTQRGDTGSYIVTATNIAGSGSGSFNVEVYCEL